MKPYENELLYMKYFRRGAGILSLALLRGAWLAVRIMSVLCGPINSCIISSCTKCMYMIRQQCELNLSL